RSPSLPWKDSWCFFASSCPGGICFAALRSRLGRGNDGLAPDGLNLLRQGHRLQDQCHNSRNEGQARASIENCSPASEPFEQEGGHAARYDGGDAFGAI